MKTKLSKKFLLLILLFLLIPSMGLSDTIDDGIKQHEQERKARQEKFMSMEKAEGKGFLSIPFGASKDEVYEELRLIATNLNLWNSDDFISLSEFKLGELSVEVLFYFDHEMKFYSFEFHTPEWDASGFEPHVLEDAEHLKAIFKNKYGPPAKCTKPALGILNIRDGYTRYYCEWKKVAGQSKFIGLTTRDFKYYAVGSVESISRLKIYEAYLKQQKEKEALEGAKGF